MARFAVNISHLDDKLLAFLGFDVVDENDEFKVIVDKYKEHHIVQKSRPLLYVDDVNDAIFMSAEDVTAIPDNIDV